MIRVANTATLLRPLLSLSSANSAANHPPLPLSLLHYLSTTTTNKNNNDDWNDAWETAWLPDDLSSGNTTTPPSPWDSNDISGEASLPSGDAETTAFVAEMNENWEERRRRSSGSMGEERENKEDKKVEGDDDGGGLYKLENVKRDYRLKKQRIHAGLWVKEIEKLQEANLGGGSGDDDIEKLLDSCSDIFDSANNDLNNAKVPSTSEFKNKPDGWETTSKSEDGNVWDMSQREEDILLQEFERRMAFCKFQIASFIKTHIFSRRRPIDGWKYMIEVIGPNAKRGKGSVSRIPSLADAATQPFTEERTPIGGGRLSRRGR